MNEFETIARFFKPLSRDGKGIRIGIGDDGAVLRAPRGRELVIATDTLVAGVHFPTDFPPRAIGHRALAVNLSDLAAMGADPAWYTLAVSLPKIQTAWLGAFARGLDQMAREADIHLVGGDTVRSPVLSATITVVGTVPRGQALRRSAARIGDGIFITGPLGLAARGLALWREGARRGHALRAFMHPVPRLPWIPALRKHARAAIDVSDGFAQDLGHLLQASRVGAEIDLDRIPRNRRDPDSLGRALFGGDDYELCFTAPQSRLPALRADAQSAQLPLFEVGRITAGKGIHWRLSDGSPPPRVVGQSFDHFARSRMQG